jgi:hypothetical protein
MAQDKGDHFVPQIAGAPCSAEPSQRTLGRTMARTVAPRELQHRWERQQLRRRLPFVAALVVSLK